MSKGSQRNHWLFFSMDVNVDDTIDNGLGDLKVGSWPELEKFGDSDIKKSHPLECRSSSIKWETGFEILWVLVQFVSASTNSVTCSFSHSALASEGWVMDGADVGERALIPCPHVTPCSHPVLYFTIWLWTIMSSCISLPYFLESFVCYREG